MQKTVNFKKFIKVFDFLISNRIRIESKKVIIIKSGRDKKEIPTQKPLK